MSQVTRGRQLGLRETGLSGATHSSRPIRLRQVMDGLLGGFGPHTLTSSPAPGAAGRDAALRQRTNLRGVAGGSGREIVSAAAVLSPALARSLPLLQRPPQTSRAPPSTRLGSARARDAGGGA
jgi:hypothetical protein